MRKLLITGAGGFVGWHVCHAAAANWEIYGIVRAHAVRAAFIRTVRIDLTNRHEVRQVFEEIRPDAVIHTAAAANPEYCEQHPQAAYAINVAASVRIARYCAERRIPLVFTSTDIVFDGLNPPYRETDRPCPVNIYGEQKALAEERLLSVYPGATICRLPLMFGRASPGGMSFLQPLLADLRRGRSACLFADEFRTPISADTAADGLLLALAKATGILHLGGAERISRYRFGCLVAESYGLDAALLIRSSQKEANMLASRPPDVSLDSRKARSLGFSPPFLAAELERLSQQVDRWPSI